MTTPLILHWTQVPAQLPELWADMAAHFEEVHSAHVARVRRNIQLMADYYESQQMFDISLQLAQRAIQHDQSKLHDPEYVPYVWRVYRTKWNKDNKQDKRFTTFFSDQTLDQAIRDAVYHHITHNRHHPEWHFDPDDMNKVDLTEMVCDWYAISQEFGSSIDEWVASVVPRRYVFGKRIPFIRSTVQIVKQLDVNTKLGKRDTR